LRQRLTRLAHEILARHLGPGDLVVDATAGNGHDTLFLALRVSPGGHVFAFDLQKQALENTRERLAQAGSLCKLTLLQYGHERMSEKLPAEARGRLAAVMFNLGYLPGGDKQLTTSPSTTLAALQQSLELLAPGAILSVLAYRQHPGGQEECEAVRQALNKTQGFRLEIHDSPGPVLFLAHKDG